MCRDKKTGMLKGDGLVTFLKRPSVELAINILDGTPFRPGMITMMKVQEARFELKGEYKRPSKPKKKVKKKVCAGHVLSILGLYQGSNKNHQCYSSPSLCF